MSMAHGDIIASTVLHIPHASRAIPPAVRPTLLLDDAELDAELRRMTDAWTDELFAPVAPEIRRVVHPVSRLVVDPERFRDDAAEQMAARGMGAVYTRTADGRPLREALEPAARARLMADWYDPHHHRLGRAVEEALAAHGHCLVIDCHSFPSIPLPCDLDQARPRPAVCIGTDEFHTPPELVSTAVEFCEARGLEVGVDRPYAGALVPEDWNRRDRRVRSIMVEINRSLYMDERTGERLGAFTGVAGMVPEMLIVLIRSSLRTPVTGAQATVTPSR